MQHSEYIGCVFSEIDFKLQLKLFVFEHSYISNEKIDIIQILTVWHIIKKTDVIDINRRVFKISDCRLVKDNSQTLVISK